MNIVILSDNTTYNVYCMVKTECDNKILREDLMIQLNTADELGQLLNKLAEVGLSHMQTSFEDVDPSGETHQKITEYNEVEILGVEVSSFDNTVIDIIIHIPTELTKEERINELQTKLLELQSILDQSDSENNVEG